MLKKFALIVLAAVLSLSCAGHQLPDLDPPPGDLPRPELPLHGIMYLSVEFEGTLGGGSCTAIAVSPTQALTAAHCFEKGPVERAELLAPDASHYVVDEIKVHSGADVAAVTVKDGTFSEWAQMDLRTPKFASIMWVAGYGCPPRITLGVRPAVFEADLLNYYGLTGLLCFGDSGGPLFTNEGKLAGINVRKGEAPDGTPVLLSTPVSFGVDLL